METERDRVRKFFKSLFIIFKYYLVANVCAIITIALGSSIIDGMSRSNINNRFYILYIVIFIIFSFAYYYLNLSIVPQNFTKSQRVLIRIVFVMLLFVSYLLYLFAVMLAFDG